MPSNSPSGSNTEVVLASLSVMSEVQEKEISRAMKEIADIEKEIDELVKEVHELKLSMAKLETRSGSALAMVKTIGVPLFIGAIIALATFYFSSQGG
jgi:predicted  nucleic acid-binding Zn-ribbon protein